MGATDDDKNFYEFINWFYYFYNLSVNRFRWENLPDNIPARFIEEQLFWGGQVYFWRHPEYGFLVASEGHKASATDIYGEPLAYDMRLQGGSGQRTDFRIPAEDVVVCRDNRGEYAPFLYAWRYAGRISDAGRAIEVIQNNMKIPFFSSAKDEQQISFKLIKNHWQNNAPLIMVDKDLDISKSLITPNTPNPQVLSVQWENKKNLLAEYLDIIGIKTNTDNFKKERSVAAEMEGDDEYVRSSKDIYLETRKDAAKRMNEKFGCSVTVRESVTTAQDEAQPAPEQDKPE